MLAICPPKSRLSMINALVETMARTHKKAGCWLNHGLIDVDTDRLRDGETGLR